MHYLRVVEDPETVEEEILINPKHEFTISEITEMLGKSYEDISREIRKGLLPVIRYKWDEEVKEAAKKKKDVWLTEKPEIGIAYIAGDSLMAYLWGETKQDPLYDELNKRKRYSEGWSLDLVNAYLNETRTIDLLTVEDERFLSQKIQEGSEAALDYFVSANLRLVVSLAKRYNKIGSLDFMDLIQAGNNGLQLSALKFDYKKGNRFSTYAHWWIKQGIELEISNHCRNIRISKRLTEDYRIIIRRTNELSFELGREPTIGEIAKALSWDPDTVQNIKDIFTQCNNVASIDESVSRDSYVPLRNIIPDERSERQDSVVAKQQEERVIAKSLIGFKRRTRDFLERRYGLNGYKEPQTLEEIGEAYGITRQAVEQITSKALAKMRTFKGLQELGI